LHPGQGSGNSKSLSDAPQGDVCQSLFDCIFSPGPRFSAARPLDSHSCEFRVCNPFRIHTYKIQRNRIKIRHFKPCRIHSYRKASRKLFRFCTYKKRVGEGGEYLVRQQRGGRPYSRESSLRKSGFLLPTSYFLLPTSDLRLPTCIFPRVTDHGARVTSFAFRPAHQSPATGHERFSRVPAPVGTITVHVLPLPPHPPLSPSPPLTGCMMIERAELCRN
jgi:hypothetical protein